MKQAITRLSIICSISLFSYPCYAVSVSDLLISEVMANPSAISDTRGEWFELFNPTDQPVNLRGLDLGDDGSKRHRFDSDLLILPAKFLTLARSSAPGFTPDYVYDNFTLTNSSDEIIFRDGLMELLRLDYSPGFAVAGHSRELQQLPMLASNYKLTLASLTYGAGDIGTPGASASMLQAPSTVPIPAAAWLFISGLLTILAPTALRKARATPAAPAISTNPVIPIRRPDTSDRADTSVRRIGISKWQKFASPNLAYGSQQS